MCRYEKHGPGNRRKPIGRYIAINRADVQPLTSSVVLNKLRRTYAKISQNVDEAVLKQLWLARLRDSLKAAVLVLPGNIATQSAAADKIWKVTGNKTSASYAINAVSEEHSRDKLCAQMERLCSRMENIEKRLKNRSPSRERSESGDRRRRRRYQDRNDRPASRARDRFPARDYSSSRRRQQIPEPPGAWCSYHKEYRERW